MARLLWARRIPRVIVRQRLALRSHYDTVKLGSGVNDCDPSGNLMEAYRNYRHRACLEISMCHEEEGDREAALRYAVLARDRYPYRSWCGTCLMDSKATLRERIERLERADGGD